MDAKKVLCYYNSINLNPMGGPAGYLFNLKQGIPKDSHLKLDFLDVKETKSKYPRLFEWCKKRKYLMQLIYMYKRQRDFYILFKSNKNIAAVDLSSYDGIHFHSCSSLYSVRDSLKNFPGKVILTMHSPRPAHQEMINDQYNKLERRLWGSRHEHFYENMVEFCIDTADYVIFPCPEAEETYYKNWNKYSEIKQRNITKYHYLLTGTRACSASVSPERIRKTYNIPENAFVICYVGRHNEVKGYDQLIKLGKHYLNDNENVYFLIAGNEYPLKGLKHPRWIEVGWTSDPHSVINASDVFVLPNKETYFDLVMLEVLSLGKIVVTTLTGGNRYFSKVEFPGVFFFQTLNELINILNKLFCLTSAEKKELEKSNKHLYELYFSNEIFGHNYINLVSELLDERVV